MTTRKFDPNTLLNDWCVLDDPILDRITDHSRWSVHHEVIFQAPDDGRFYRADYSVGATEFQDERPWEYRDHVTATEVHEVEVTVKKWVPVDRKAPSTPAPSAQ